MNRDIKFRGKRADNGEWVYGGVSIFENEATIFDSDCIVNSAYDVLPETVGQFTGLKEIYEGDVCYCEYGITGVFNKAIIYQENACFYADDKDPSGNMPLSYWFENANEIEIIGNIHDNPELLK